MYNERHFFLWSENSEAAGHGQFERVSPRALAQFPERQGCQFTTSGVHPPIAQERAVEGIACLQAGAQVEPARSLDEDIHVDRVCDVVIGHEK